MFLFSWIEWPAFLLLSSDITRPLQSVSSVPLTPLVKIAHAAYRTFFTPSLPGLLGQIAFAGAEQF